MPHVPVAQNLSGHGLQRRLGVTGIRNSLIPVAKRNSRSVISPSFSTTVEKAGACTYKGNETLRADVRLAPNSGARADIPGSPLWAKARSRCAPARCAGARAERP